LVVRAVHKSPCHLERRLTKEADNAKQLVTN